MTTSIQYRVLKTWNGGFKAEFTLTNTGTAPIADWWLTFDLGTSIRGSWRAEVTENGDGSFIARGLSYDKDIPAGKSVSFGTIIEGSASAAPENFVVKGGAVQPGPPPDSIGDPPDGGQPPATDPNPGTDPTEGGPGGTPGVPSHSPGDGSTGPVTSPSGPTIHVAAGASAAQVQQLVDSVSAGAEIRLAAGNFTFDRPIVIDRDDVALHGAGSDKTKILIDQASGAIGPAIYIDGGSPRGKVGLTKDAAEGDKALALGEGHGFAAGDFLWIQAPNTADFFKEIGDTAWLKDKPLRTSLAKVVGASQTGVVLEDGVHFDFEAGSAEVYRIDMVENVSVGGFSLSYSFGEPDPAKFSNTLPKYDRIAAVELDGAYRVGVTDIAVHDAPSVAFNFLKSLRVGAGELFADGAHNKGSGGNGYAVQIKDTYESAFSGIEDHGMRHSVLFGSWYSAANNTVHVRYTDRDINFHGGRDHGNMVHVETSERDPRADVMSTSLWYNLDGESWGAPTDPNANTITFDRMIGSKRSEYMIKGGDFGAHLDGRDGNDVLTGGAGDDTLIGGAGKDVLDGQAGLDRAVYSSALAEYRLTLQGDGTAQIKGPDGTDILKDIELGQFADGTVRLADLVEGYQPDESVATKPPTGPSAGSPAPSTGSGDPSGQPESQPGVLFGSDDKDTYAIHDSNVRIQESAGGGWDAVDSTVTYTLNEHVEQLTLIGPGPLDGFGNDGRNVLRGNDSENFLKGHKGDDDLYGRVGDDRLYGGSGDDTLNGGGGDDLLQGGGGTDLLTGGSGADVFQFIDADYVGTGAKADRITDFDASEGDVIDLGRVDANAVLSGDQDFVFVGTDEFRGVAGEVRVANGTVAGDVDGNARADFEIGLVGNPSIGIDNLLGILDSAAVAGF